MEWSTIKILSVQRDQICLKPNSAYVTRDDIMYYGSLSHQTATIFFFFHG